MRVRPAVVEDADRIALVHVRSWQAAYRGLLPQDLLDDLDGTVPRRAAWWADRAGDAESVTLVGEFRGSVMAFAHAGPARDAGHTDHAELYAVYALAEAWGTGVGHALHEAALARLRDAGFRDAVLWVLDGNERAIRFYERHGWRFDGSEQHEPWGEVVLHERRMVRSLREHPAPRPVTAGA